MGVVSLFKYREQCYIQAINNDNDGKFGEIEYKIQPQI